MLKEEFPLDEIEPWLKAAVQLFFVGEEENPRVRWLVQRLVGGQGRLISLNHRPGPDTLDVTETDLRTGMREKPLPCNLMTDFPRLLDDLSIREVTVCVDISGMQYPVMFLLFKLLTIELIPRQLFASYVMPERYNRAEYDGPFELSDEFLGIGSLPGFLRRASTQPAALLVAFLGFEGLRLPRVLDGLGPRPKRIIPVFGFPSFEAGWNILALEQNMAAIESNNLYGEIVTCEAASVYEAYRILEDAHRNASDGQILICPLGTRPHALASALYATTQPGVRILYDRPVEKRFRSLGVRTCRIYHLSRFCRRV